MRNLHIEKKNHNRRNAQNNLKKNETKLKMKTIIIENFVK